MGARFRIVPACGYVSVVRSGSLSDKHSKQDLERLRDIDFVLEALPGLSAAERAMIRKHQKSIDARVQWLEVIEAVKAKNASRVLRAYCRSPQVAQYLTARLSEQLFERTSKRLKAFTEAQEGNRLSPSSGALDFWVTGDRDANRQGGLKPQGVSL
jgi:succinoglycan biosynthesis protein ExoU